MREIPYRSANLDWKVHIAVPSSKGRAAFLCAPLLSWLFILLNGPSVACCKHNEHLCYN
jgi:hypothetical protein